MGDYRKNYIYTKFKLLNNKGIALITTIILIAAILIISGAMLYLIMRGIRGSGEFQRFESVQAAAEGGIEITTSILDNFESVFYNSQNNTLQLENRDNITFNKIKECTIEGDDNSTDGARLDRYLIGMTPDKRNYEDCQAAVWKIPFITITPLNESDAPYSKIEVYIRKEQQGPAAGQGGSASLTAPYDSPGGTAMYLLSIRSFATHYKTNDNSSIEMLYYLSK